MTRHPPTWSIVLLAALGALSVTVGILGPWLSPWYDGGILRLEHLVHEVSNGLLFLLGLFAWLRRPGNRVGLLIMAVPLLGSLTLLSWGDDGLLFTVSLFLLVNLDMVALAHLFLAFPTGRLETTAHRVTVAGLYAYCIASNALGLAVWDVTWNGRFTNPFVAAPSDGFLAAMWHAQLAITVVQSAWVLWLGLHRWLRASPPRRRVLTPILVASIPTALWVVGNFSLQRYLGEADTAMRTNTLFATLALSALPVGYAMGLWRSRVNRARVGDLVIELGTEPAEVGRVRATLAEVFRDPSLLVAYRLPGRGLVDEFGHPVDVPDDDEGLAVTPVEAHGETIALLMHDPAVLLDPELLAGGVAATRLAVDNERLQAGLRAQLEEVRASRARIVAAGDVERRRIERNLHDGAQQRLTTLALQLGRMRASLSDDVGQALADSLDAATDDLRGALADLRELARGIHPPILTEEGLAAAVDVLAQRHPVSVEVTAMPERRLPEHVEATAYYVIAESLTNIARHAHADRVTVTATLDGDHLGVVIRDDGAGGADVAGGTGLAGLDDRVTALGGRLDIRSIPGVGTTVEAVIPLGGEPLA